VYQQKKASGESTAKKPSEEEMLNMIERVKQRNANKNKATER
jgi:hypothetical protein